MLADNVGYGDIGGAFQGGEIRGMPTPRIDKLQSEGLVLTQFITEPGSTPSRAGLVTGRYAHRSGLGSSPGTRVPAHDITGCTASGQEIFGMIL